MMNLNTALGLIMLVAAIIALIQEGKDKTVQLIAGILCALSVVVCAEQFVPIIDDLITGVWWKVLGSHRQPLRVHQAKRHFAALCR